MIALLAGGAIIGRKVQGVAAIAPLPGAPALGDCVTELLLPPNISVRDEGKPPVYETVVAEPCTGARMGEVVGVIDRPGPLVVREVIWNGEVQGESLDDPNQENCATLSREYLGLGGPANDAMNVWVPLGDYTSSLTPGGPTDLQRAFGQGWAVCVVQDDYNRIARDAVGFEQSIRDAYQRFPVPPGLASCEQPCDTVHRSEYFAFGTYDRPTDWNEILESCKQLVVERTGLPAITDMEGLDITIEASADELSAATPELPAGAACVVTTGDGLWLQGSLLNVGDPDRIPWS
ncbi:hypothetical protein GIS00_02455 [Nakamurella sp. YIM 132087]|uniref:Septum formation-related domain-containing protein n=1 Tax=Nakamurella alba TaxID=2665158 RepID=A0A7K1FFF5_9ACTN|nr:hypothetical protein [Nakamurella alba]MTD12806.1 hypothetical protein [Nakamurella alba]